MGQLGDIKNLTLNNLKSLGPLHFTKLDAGKCSIPGFVPPNLPSLALPPIPVFAGIPAFNLFCLLPPFPGLPALSLPSVSIPIPPIPFVPPIPIPIPGFALPTLPLLPAIDLGSLNFLCGLLNIRLPVLDIFGGLNQLLSKLNSLINALNDFLNFCKTNAEVINATEVPPDNNNTIAAVPTVNQTPSTGLTTGGLKVPQPTQTNQLALNGIATSQTIAKPDLSKLKFTCDEPASNLALYLANDGQIPADPSIINKVAQSITSLNTPICDITNDQLAALFKSNKITSPAGFVGFKNQDIPEDATDTTDLLNKLVAKKKLDKNFKKTAFDAIKSLSIPATSTFEIALQLNNSGVPFGIPPTNLQIVTADDIARAFYIKQTIAPLDATKIITTLAGTGTIDMSGDNVALAIQNLTPLPSPLDPYTIANAIRNVVAGPSAPSLKAMCIAASRGINAQTTPDIIRAKQNTLLELAGALNSSSFVKYFTNSTFQDFERVFKQFNVPFPLSLYEAIPLLAIYFQVDDRVLEELFTSFNISNTFNSLGDLFNFLVFAAHTVSSQNAVIQAITNCEQVKQGDFSFTALVNNIQITLRKYGLSEPFNSSQHRNIANALALELSFNYNNTMSVFDKQSFSTLYELSFLVLATGLFTNSIRSKLGTTQTATSTISGLVGYLKNPIEISIHSPTGVIADIIVASINISMTTIQNFSLGVSSKTRELIQNGSPSNGVAITTTSDDFLQTIKIIINRIADFDVASEAIETIDVEALYSTIVSTSTQQVPMHLIQISF